MVCPRCYQRAATPNGRCAYCGELLIETQSQPADFVHALSDLNPSVLAQGPLEIFVVDAHAKSNVGDPKGIGVVAAIALPQQSLNLPIGDQTPWDGRQSSVSFVLDAIEAGSHPLEMLSFRTDDAGAVALRLSDIPSAVSPTKSSSDSYHREIENSLRLMQFSIDRAGDAVYWVRPNSQIVNVNEAACRTLGYSKHQLIGKYIEEIDPNYSIERWPQRWKDLREQKSMTFRSNQRRSDGAIIDVEVTCNYFQHEDNELSCAIVRDLTAHKHANEQLQMLQFAVDQSSDVVFWLGKDGRIRQSNQAATDRMGYSSEQLLGMSILDLNPELTPAIWEDYWHAMSRIGTRMFETRHRTANGDFIPVEVTASYVDLGDDELIFTSSRDIAERKRAEASLRAREERYSLVERAVNDGIWDWNIETDGMFCSTRWHELLGYKDGELAHFKTRDYWNLIHPDDRQLLMDFAMQSFQRNERYKAEIRLRHKDGSYRWMLSRGEAVRNESGIPVRVVGSITDITEHKRAEEQTVQLRDSLAHVTRLGILGELAAGLAHELNQPLAALRLYATTAEHLGAQFDSPELIDCLRRIDEQSHRAAEIVRRMRSFVSHRMSQREPVRPNDLALEVLSLLSNELKHGQVKVEATLGAELPLVHADAIHIQQVLVNLIRNAMDAMAGCSPPERRLIVHTAKAGDHVRFSIADSGSGLNPEMESKLFQPFQTSKTNGLGLGLAISRTVIESHGGAISAAPNPKGGMTFFFTLPAHNPS